MDKVLNEKVELLSVNIALHYLILSCENFQRCQKRILYYIYIIMVNDV